MAKSIAIVTGASSGVGREFVRQFDQGAGGPLDEIWLIARRREVLEDIAATCKTATRVLALDLTDEASFETISAELDRGQPRVQWLVNSAGFGKFGDFNTVDEKDTRDMVKLNCLAVVESCYRVLPHMGPGSSIINLASIAGVIPQPRLSVYSATKSFVLEFSRTVDHELHGTGIHITALCPKFMHTGFLDKPNDSEVARKMCVIGFSPVDKVVRKAIRAAVLGRALCIPSADMWAAHIITKLLPSNVSMELEDMFMGMWEPMRTADRR
jgi:short-subunit dehydrogenase